MNEHDEDNLDREMTRRVMSYGNNFQRGGYQGRQSNQTPGFQHKPNGGSAMINQNKTKETQPDYRGDLAIDDEVLDYIVNAAQNNERPVIGFALWNGQTSKGVPSMSIKLDLSMKEKEARGIIQPRQGAGHQPAPRYQTQTAPSQRYGGGQSGGSTNTGQTGGRYDYRQRNQAPSPQQQEQERQQFARGDSLPDFMKDDRQDSLPPFDGPYTRR